MATALYRRYRPQTFAEVVGQEHVTGPLRAALRAGRANHAYLFSGPRGCGKTTSARILARCLNCEQGPTDTPCGVCPSCVDLARGGSGSLDVVEIDAASHGGVDDARELRERAAFAPARDRYKVYVIDEAHMVTPQGFNALLKIVEEPPEHVMFVFATTEPDKVLGTIRSRTHHYPFHLVPPGVLTDYLAQLCETEGIGVGEGVLPLVVRAGAGSVRDSLSVLDQLAAGAEDGVIDYSRAVALLGYTHASLLDDVVAAFAAGDGASVFGAVDRVVSSGQDPRRFVDDLLQRLRDLVIVQAVGERAREVFPGVAADQLQRMAVQAAAFGASALSRCADLANTASTEMTGATSPRLHLELLCARMLLPAADDGQRGLGARLDRLERRLEVPVPDTALAPAPSPPPVAGGALAAAAPAAVTPVQPVAPVQPAVSAPAGDPGAAPAGQGPAEPAAAAPAVLPVPAAVAPVADPAAPTSDGGSRAPTADATESVRRLWPQVLDHLAANKRRTWTRVSQDVQVLTVDDTQAVLGFTRPGNLAAFTQGAHADGVRESLVAVVGLDRQVVGVAASGGPPAAPQSQARPAAAVTEPAAGAPVEPAAPAPTPVEPSAPEEGPRPAPEALVERTAPREASDQPTSRPAPDDREAPAAEPPPVRPFDRSAATAPPARRLVEVGPDFPPEPIDDGEPEPPEGDWGRPSRLAQEGGAAGTVQQPPVQQPPVQQPAVQGRGREQPHPAGEAVPPAAPSPARASQPPSPGGAGLRGADLVRSAVRSLGAAAPGGATEGAPAGATRGADDDASYDDPDAEGSGLIGVAVAEQLLGARIVSIDERR